MLDIIFCCAKKDEFKGKWNYKINGANNTFLIAFDRNATDPVASFEKIFEAKYNEYKNSGNIYVVFHGGQDEWNTFINNLNSGDTINKAKHFFYSLKGGSREEKLIGKKVLKPLANAVRDGKSKLFEDRFEWLLKLCKGETTIDKIPWSYASTINKVLCSFLPLDIDMQALSDKKVDKEKYLQEMDKDLKKLYSSEEKKNSHYRRKLYDLWYLLKGKEWLKKNRLEYSPELEEFDSINQPNSELCEFAGIRNGQPDLSFSIHNFLTILDTDALENKVMEIYKPLDITVNDKEKPEKINTFHEWYCRLGEYLKVLKSD